MLLYLILMTETRRSPTSPGGDIANRYSSVSNLFYDETIATIERRLHARFNIAGFGDIWLLVTADFANKQRHIELAFENIASGRRHNEHLYMRHEPA